MQFSQPEPFARRRRSGVSQAGAQPPASCPVLLGARCAAWGLTEGGRQWDGAKWGALGSRRPGHPLVLVHLRGVTKATKP